MVRNTAVVRREVKKAIDQLPADRLASLADYVAFLARPDLHTTVRQSEADIQAGKGVNWRGVRKDV